MLAATAAIALLGACGAGARTLRMCAGAQITSADPHVHDISPSNAFASMVFDTLIETDDRARIHPGLALS